MTNTTLSPAAAAKRQFLSKLFKAAWTIVRRDGATLSQALKKAWACAKKDADQLAQLTGTTKQIAWAQDIRSKQLDQLHDLLAALNQDNDVCRLARRIVSDKVAELSREHRAATIIRYRFVDYDQGWIAYHEDVVNAMKGA